MTAVPPPPSPLAQPGPWDEIASAYEESTVPFFEAYAAAALRRVPPSGARVLDVAAGPGTLALLAAATALYVRAVDFAPAMIDRLRARAERAGFANVVASVADGQALPFDDGSFDRAYSMFGLIFFPDRARGLAEMARVLVPGGRMALSSWPPLRSNPLQAMIMEEAARQIPGFPLRLDEAPLGDVDALTRELGDAGFVNVDVREAQAILPARTLGELMANIQRTCLPLRLLKKQVGDAAHAHLLASLEARLRATVTPEIFARPWTALIASGDKPRA